MDTRRLGRAGVAAAISDSKVLFGCDNNFPNTGRNPTLADDSEFIVVKAPGLVGG